MFNPQQNLYNSTQSNLLNQNPSTGLMNGNLVIRPLEASLTHNTELIGKMSPYLKLILGNESKLSNVAKKMHKNPTWDQELVFRYHGEQSLRCEVWHKELLGDDLVGYGTLDLSTCLRQGNFMGDVPLFYKDKDAGCLRLSMNFFEDGSPYNPFTSQQLQAKGLQSGFIGGTTLGQSMPVLPSQSVLAGSTQLGTGVETTFLPTQTNLSNVNVSTARTTFVQENLEPIYHKETQRIIEQPVYIHQRPVVHEKTVIIEKPIITEKTIIEREIPIIKEMCELREKTFYQKQAPILIRENPIVKREELSTSMDKLNLEGEPIITRQTELKRDAPQYFHERTEVFDKEVIHERPIIHEKDIIFVEKPIHIEKPEILERPILTAGGSQLFKEGLIKREVVAEDLTIPAEAIIHADRVVLKEPPTFFKERPEIFEREIIVEKPILYDQPVIFTEKQEIHEKAEFIEKRGRRIEQPIVERSDIVLVRADTNPEFVRQQQQSTLTSTSRVSQTQQNLTQTQTHVGDRPSYDFA
jgi:hypothetical protein